jgi:hypothetical protein
VPATVATVPEPVSALPATMWRLYIAQSATPVTGIGPA